MPSLKIDNASKRERISGFCISLKTKALHEEPDRRNSEPYFQHYKPPGMDIINSAAYLNQFLENIFLAYLDLGYVIPSTQKVKVIFILNLGKGD